MKLKVNARILLGLIIVIILALGGCSIPSTITAVIVDSNKAPINKAGVTVSATYGGLPPVKVLTAGDGSAALRLGNVSYPVTVTAKDDVHVYTPVVINNEAELHTRILIIEKLFVRPPVIH